MTVTVLWWHMPAFLTLVWVVLCFWPIAGGNSIFDSIGRCLGIAAGLVVLLLIWVLAMAWRILA